MGGPRDLAKRIMPDDAINWYRRQRVKRLYLDALSRELLARQTALDDIEGRMAAKQNGFSERVVKDVVERTEIILQELERRIEGLQARTGQRLDGVERELAELREAIQRIDVGTAQLPEPTEGARANGEVLEAGPSETRPTAKN